MNMKHTSLLGGLLAATLLSFNTRADSSGGTVDFGKFSPPAGGGEFVEVNIKGNLLSMAAKLTEKAEPEAAQLLRGLQAVRVNVIGLNDQNKSELKERIKSVQQTLASQNWERIVTAQKDNQDVGVYVKTRGEEAIEGLVVTVLEGEKQVVFVNVVGDIRPEKLAQLGERLHIDELKTVGQSIEKK